MNIFRKIYRNKYKIILALLILLVYATTKGLLPVSEIDTKGSPTKTTVTAEDIKRILELNGASQKVTVETDTSFVSISVPHILGFNISIMEREIPHRLNEIRTYIIKAGTNAFDLQKTSEGYTLQLRKPIVTSREHLVELYTEKKRIGTWNPVTVKMLEIQSRDKAVAKAIEDGILLEAQYGIENALYGILPSNVRIVWNN